MNQQLSNDTKTFYINSINVELESKKCMKIQECESKCPPLFIIFNLLQNSTAIVTAARLAARANGAAGSKTKYCRGWMGRGNCTHTNNFGGRRPQGLAPALTQADGGSCLCEMGWAKAVGDVAAKKVQNEGRN